MVWLIGIGLPLVVLFYVLKRLSKKWLRDEFEGLEILECSVCRYQYLEYSTVQEVEEHLSVIEHCGKCIYCLDR